MSYYLAMALLSMHPQQTLSLTAPPLAFSKVHGLGNDFILVTEENLCLHLVSQGLALAASDSARTSYGAVHTEPVTASLLPALKSILSNLAVFLCDRRRGIGGDGLIVAVRSSYLAQNHNERGPLAVAALVDSYSSERDGVSALEAPFSWIYVNSDGSYSSMCGNGLRTLALFMARQGWLKEHLPVRTDSGGASAAASVFQVRCADYPVHISIQSIDGDSTGSGASRAVVSTRLARPLFSAADIPLDLSDRANPESQCEFIAAPITLKSGQVKATAVSMGNPHCVIFERQEAGTLPWLEYALDMQGGQPENTLSGLPATNSNSPTLRALSEEIQSSSLFPQGANVEWVKILSPEKVRVYVVERGCGPTLACASGAAAVVAAGVREGLLKRQCCVILPGGELAVSYLDGGMQEQIELTGPAEFVFDGVVSVHSHLFSEPGRGLLIPAQASANQGLQE
ncbi:MAG: hypothetical protein HY986_21635 [Candidatus Melainabacteria bacterium]|nr:hypothetical protein [Candidatus Melainabacteria bacterium]